MLLLFALSLFLYLVLHLEFQEKVAISFRHLKALLKK